MLLEFKRGIGELLDVRVPREVALTTKREQAEGLSCGVATVGLAVRKGPFRAQSFLAFPYGEVDLRNFAGAHDAKGTTKGIFVTTAQFTPAAKKYVEQSPKRIILINGEEFASLMVEHNIGVRTDSEYTVKRIDRDYFE